MNDKQRPPEGERTTAHDQKTVSNIGDVLAPPVPKHVDVHIRKQTVAHIDEMLNPGSRSTESQAPQGGSSGGGSSSSGTSTQGQQAPKKE